MDGWMRPARNALIVALVAVGLLTVPGQVALTAVTGHLIALGTATRAECRSPKPQDPDNFYYVGVTECGDDYKEASANLTLPQMDKLNVENELARTEAAKVDPDGHSLGEIAIVQSIQTADHLCNLDGIEAGWIVQNKDLDKIRFFVYKTDAWQGNFFSGYAPDARPWPGDGWVSLGVRPQPNEEIPNEAIPAGQPLKLGIHYDPNPADENGRWYVSVNGKDVGYYRGNGWSGACGDFKPDRIQ